MSQVSFLRSSGEVTRQHPDVRSSVVLGSCPGLVKQIGMAIARISGCEIETAMQVVKALPTTLPILLYPHQAQRLALQLNRVQVSAEAVSESVDR